MKTEKWLVAKTWFRPDSSIEADFDADIRRLRAVIEQAGYRITHADLVDTWRAHASTFGERWKALPYSAEIVFMFVQARTTAITVEEGARSPEDLSSDRKS